MCGERSPVGVVTSVLHNGIPPPLVTEFRTSGTSTGAQPPGSPGQPALVHQISPTDRLASMTRHWRAPATRHKCRRLGGQFLQLQRVGFWSPLGLSRQGRPIGSEIKQPRWSQEPYHVAFQGVMGSPCGWKPGPHGVAPAAASTVFVKASGPRR